MVFRMVHRFSKSERRERESSSEHDDNEDARPSLTTCTVQITMGALRYMSYRKLYLLLEIAASMNQLSTTCSIMSLYRHNTWCEEEEEAKDGINGTLFISAGILLNRGHVWHKCENQRAFITDRACHNCERP